MLKTVIHLATRIFSDLFRDIWTNDVVPNNWNTGLIVKLPKKGYIQYCDKWRRVTLLSVPSKISCRVLLNRIEGVIDVKVREELGIQWTLFSQLEDLDYTDNITLVSTPANHLQKNAQLLTENVSKTGRQINEKKTKVMCMNLKDHPQITIDKEEHGVVID